MTLCAAVRPARHGVRIVCLGGLASLYVLGAGWLFHAELKSSLGMSSARVTEVAKPLRDALVAVLGDSRLLLVGSAVLLGGWALAAPGLARRFAVCLPLAALLGLLNPHTAGWVAVNVTGPAYWRSLWAVPLPIVLALVLSAPLHLGRVATRPLLRGAAWLILLTTFACLVPRSGGLSRANAVRLGWPQIKVPEAAYRWAEEVNRRAPAGSHVAVPSDIAVWIVTQHHHVYPLVVRDYLHAPAPHLSRQALRQRVAMQSFLDAPELVDATPELFRQGLDRFEVRAVCLVNDPRAEVARSILQQSGFTAALVRDDYVLWLRPAQAPLPQPVRP
ncbi:MAG: hypothetical protein ABI629_16275 [bacterium]